MTPVVLVTGRHVITNASLAEDDLGMDGLADRELVSRIRVENPIRYNMLSFDALFRMMLALLPMVPREITVDQLFHFQEMPTR